MVRAPFGALRKTVSPSVPRQRECTKPWKAALLTWMVPSSTVWEWRWRIFCPDRPPQFPETVMTLCPTKKTALWNIYCRMLTIRCIMMSCIIVTGICSGQSMRMPLSTACCGRSAAAPSTSVTKLGTQIRMCWSHWPITTAKSWWWIIQQSLQKTACFRILWRRVY